jgi:hypothetical protein
MNLWKTSRALAVALVLCATAAYAQDQKQDTSPLDPNAPLQPLDTRPSAIYPNKTPIGAARGVTTTYNPQQYDPSQVTPDQNTLAGATPFTLGSMQHTSNIFDPAISISQLGETLPGTTGKTILAGISIASGSLNFTRNWSEYHFSTLYNGGETFNIGFGAAGATSGVNSPHYQFHDLIVSQEADWARWHVIVRDDFAASPGAAFTGQGMGGPGLASEFSSVLNTSLSSFSQAFQPAETINTGTDMRYRNSILGQLEYSFSRRSALTLSGSYGLLQFTGTGYFNSTMENAQAGYDFLLDPSDSIAILGNYGRINYSGTVNSVVGSGTSIVDYVGDLAYGRKITGRLAFQVAAGPQDILWATPAGNFQLVFASVNTALTYERRRSGVSFTYARGLNGGSGVFLGATGNTFTGKASYQFTRFWKGSINAGYAMNDSLPTAAVATVRFDNWFAGANLGRLIGPHAQINFNYGASEQNSPANCPVANCGGTGLQQTIGVSINWHLRPIDEAAR